MPNVIVVCANGLQTAYLGTYGNPWIHTPNIDRMAARGVVFDWHFPDNLTTLPARRSWWSGQYTIHDPLKSWGPLENAQELELLSLLKTAKVRTTLISDCPYINDPSMGFARAWSERILVRGSGYDAWCDPDEVKVDCRKKGSELPLPPETDPNYETWKERWDDLLRNRKQTGRLLDERQTGVAQVVTKAEDWLSRQTPDSTPYLLWLDIFCPHGPWDLPEVYRDYYAADRADHFEIHETGDLVPTKPSDTKKIRSLIDVPGGWVGDIITDDELIRLRKTYAGAVTMLDTWVGHLMNYLEDTGLWDDTIIAFTSDQGEPLGEHGFVRRPVANVHEELAHTPLIVRWPDLKETGQRIGSLIQSIDLTATILNSFNLETPNHWHGKDLKPLIIDQETPWREMVITGMDNDIYAIRTHEWLLIQHAEADPDESDPKEEPDDILDTELDKPELYIKPEDRWERHDVASMNEDVVEELSAQLNQVLEKLAEAAD